MALLLWFWYNGFGKMVLVQWFWYNGFGAMLLAQWFWYNGFGTMVLVHCFWHNGFGTMVLVQWFWFTGFELLQGCAWTKPFCCFWPLLYKIIVMNNDAHIGIISLNCIKCIWFCMEQHINALTGDIHTVVWEGS